MKREEITNPDLVKALNKFLIQQSPKNEQAVIAEVKKARFLSPVFFSGSISENTFEPGSSLSFKTLSTEEEYTFLMAFTDWEEIAKWSTKPEDAIPVTYDDLKNLINESKGQIIGFTINPYEQNLMITKDLIAYFDQFEVK